MLEAIKSPTGAATQSRLGEPTIDNRYCELEPQIRSTWLPDPTLGLLGALGFYCRTACGRIGQACRNLSVVSWARYLQEYG